MSCQDVSSPRPRTAVTLAVVTAGLGLNLRASVLSGPHLHAWFDVAPAAYAVLIGLPVLVTALLRLPVGVLTDRYGARVMFPVVSVLAAASVVALPLAGSVPAVAVAGAAAGVAGTSFVVGGALVARLVPYGRRGRHLGVFGLGVAVAVLVSGVSWWADPGGRSAERLLAGLLLAFAVLAAVVLRDPVPAVRAGPPLRRSARMVRLASTTPVSLLYLLALGGMVSIAVFLPIYLSAAFALPWFRALTVTGAVVGLAAGARLAGGWWTDRRPTARLLTVCYAIAAGLCLVAALAPGSWWWAAPMITGVAVCDGVAGGVLFALIGKAARADNAGAVMGLTGSAGAVGALLPPLLFGGVHSFAHSYAPAWIILAAVLVAAALYARTHDLDVGLGLPADVPSPPRPTAMTVAVLGEPETRFGAAAVVARLAELATSDELVVVYGADEQPPPRLSARALAAGLRSQLPRHDIVTVPVARRPEALGHDALRLGEYVEAGTLAIAVAPAAGLGRVAADLSLYLQADRLLRVTYTPADGAALQPA